MILRLISIIRKEFIQIVRDPRTLGLTLVYPVAMLFVIGFVFSDTISATSLVVIDRDQSRQSRELLAAYENSEYFSLDYFVSSENEVQHLIEVNQARAAIIIPPDYSRNLTARRPAQVGFIIDGSDPNTASKALSAAALVGQAMSTRITVERTQRASRASTSAALPIDVRTQVWYNPDMVSQYYMVPALIGMILQFLTTFLTATSIVRERERGTIEQLIVTPIRPWELMAGKLAPYVLIAFFDTVEILVAGVLVFNVPINGSLGLLLVLAGMFLVTTLGLGLFISTIANTQMEAMLTTMFTMLPAVFLSGFMFSLDSMPLVLKVISYVIPLRYFLIIIRGIVLKGSSAGVLIPEIIALAITSLVIMTITALRFRKSLD
jgi:ABC-2 type transport system permease protein